MFRLTQGLLSLLAIVALSPNQARADEPLHQRIDSLIAAKADGQKASERADDAEFLRRVYLDLAGRVPSAHEAKAFLEDKSAEKRAQLIDRLLASADYPRRMEELFHVVFIERMGDNAEWSKYLRTSFEANKPFDVMAREMLAGRARDEATKGASFFVSKRLENFGQNPVDYPALTRDVGRLFLGIDLQCAQCHDHRFIKDYKQADYQGLYAFFQNAYLVDAKNAAVGEKVMIQKVAFQSVFNSNKKETGPRVPGLKEMEIEVFKKGEEFAQPPDPKSKSPGVPKFSPLAKLSEQLPTADNAPFTRNAANRLWFAMMGRGIVHPLDLNHSENPPSHPELLDLLSKEFVDHKFDIKWLLKEMALSQTYQRSSLLPDKVPPPESFLTAQEKRMSAEQLMWSMLEATGEKERVLAEKGGKRPLIDVVRAQFVTAFANPPRESEEDFAPSLKASLFVLNDDTLVGWLTPRAGNLMDRLAKLPDDKVADELYVSVLTRMPTADEKAMVGEHLKKHAARRPVALGQLAWSLLASTEFCVNH